MCVWFMLFGFHSQSATEDLFVFMETYYFIHLLFFCVTYMSTLHWNLWFMMRKIGSQYLKKVFKEM